MIPFYLNIISWRIPQKETCLARGGKVEMTAAFPTGIPTTGGDSARTGSRKTSEVEVER